MKEMSFLYQTASAHTKSLGWQISCVNLAWQPSQSLNAFECGTADRIGELRWGGFLSITSGKELPRWLAASFGARGLFATCLSVVSGTNGFPVSPNNRFAPTQQGVDHYVRRHPYAKTEER
jgi:hypothetical protein